MAKEIAVFLGDDGSSTLLDEPGNIVVFRRAQGSWEIDREKGFSMGRVKGIRELRLNMGEMLQFLDGCRIFVAKSAAGVPFFELEKAGCSVWEFDGKPSEFLEHVWQQEEKERAMEKDQAAPCLPAPEEITPGNFYISIKGIQGNADVTSKQVLQKFIRKGGFRSLVIICSHVPPWIEVEAVSSGLVFETGQSGKNEFRVRIVKMAANG
ncbi:nitrogenase [Methanocella sp. CWC-04]|uniref:Nitrogenase n=1 Tax=Methanooceanicella nereidis TaxID=2052831 RepID=A0AAP2RCE9_9EURY|nr:Fe-only nitrogenase accessory AnfO family protein [Methanocella sp. CWC-04]MCD1294291.1 nitrogenase [Methanocella sp. CWC-04]